MSIPWPLSAPSPMVIERRTFPVRLEHVASGRPVRAGPGTGVRAPVPAGQGLRARAPAYRRPPAAAAHAVPAARRRGGAGTAQSRTRTTVVGSSSSSAPAVTISVERAA